VHIAAGRVDASDDEEKDRLKMSARVIGPYELEGLLGEGGIGQVYAARDTVLGRKVAIKMLRPELSRDSNFVERFHVEAQSLGNLNHSNITTVYALHAEGDEAYMVMELVHGETLEALLAQAHRLTLRDSLAILAQAVVGMRYAHRRGVIHRDLKPANLMLTDDGVVKIMDFGIARVRGSQHLTRVGEFCGTFVYASPEQIRGEEVDERSDLYSLAIVFYRMLAGTAPFTGDNEYALMTAQLQTPPPPLTGRVPDLDPATEQVLMRALAKRREDRFASVEEFGRAVGAMALRGDSVEILTQLYTHVFAADDLEATRIVGSRPALPAGDPTMPSNRRVWQLPGSDSSLASLALSRPAAAPAAVSARPARRSVLPSVEVPAPTSFAQSPPPPARARPILRSWLIGAGALALPLLAGAGYYWTTLDAPPPQPPAASLQPQTPPPPPGPAEFAQPEPARVAPAKSESVPPTPKEIAKIEPAPLAAVVPASAIPEPPRPTASNRLEQAEAVPAPAPPRIEPVKTQPAAPPASIEPPKTAKAAPVSPPASPPASPVDPVTAGPASTAVAPAQPAPVRPEPAEQPPVQPAKIPAPAQPEQMPVAAGTVQPRVTATPSAAAIEPPKHDAQPESQSTPKGAAGASENAPNQAPGQSAPEVQVAMAPPQVPPATQPPLGPQAQAAPPNPEGEPDLQGRVGGAKRLDEIEVAGRWIKLFGIVDRARGAREAQQVQTLLRYLKPARNVLVCYRKAGDTYRCYAEGQDIARLALLDGIVQLAPNAPAEYRALLKR
jgi:serine/threonine-protein kinase